MIKSAVARMPILVFILMFFSLGYTIAHNKVVVVPLGADAGVSGYELVTASTFGTISSGGAQVQSVICPADKKPIGGGVSNSSPAFSMYTNRPSASGTGWTGRTLNRADIALPNELIVYVICADIIS